jgi:hypothetical protein
LSGVVSERRTGRLGQWQESTHGNHRLGSWPTATPYRGRRRDKRRSVRPWSRTSARVLTRPRFGRRPCGTASTRRTRSAARSRQPTHRPGQEHLPPVRARLSEDLPTPVPELRRVTARARAKLPCLACARGADRNRHGPAARSFTSRLPDCPRSPAPGQAGVVGELRRHQAVAAAPRTGGAYQARPPDKPCEPVTDLCTCVRSAAGTEGRRVLFDPGACCCRKRAAGTAPRHLPWT